MALITWNVNGFRSRIAEVCELIGTLRPAVLCLQETKCTELPPFPGYDHWLSPYSTPHHHGVAIYACSEMKGRAVEFELEFALRGRVLGVEFSGSRVFSVYTQNSMNNKDLARAAFDQNFLRTIAPYSPAAGASKNLVIAGDLNVCCTPSDDYAGYLDPTLPCRKPFEIDGFNTICAATGLQDLFVAKSPPNSLAGRFTFYSRRFSSRDTSPEYPHGRGLRLDYILAGNLAGFSHCAALNWGSSDHVPLVARPL